MPALLVDAHGGANDAKDRPRLISSLAVATSSKTRFDRIWCQAPKITDGPATAVDSVWPSAAILMFILVSLRLDQMTPSSARITDNLSINLLKQRR